MTYRDLEHRLLARSVVLPPGEQHAGCWMWMGRVEPNGYAKLGLYLGGGRAQEKVRNYWVHRLAYEVFRGIPVPEAFDVDHRCRNPICINPSHLEAVPSIINTHHRVKKQRGSYGRYV